MKRKISILLLLAMLVGMFDIGFIGMGSAYSAAAEANILEGKQYTDTGYTFGYSAKLAVDGNNGTFYSPATGLDMIFNLENPVRIGAVEIEGRNDMDQSATHKGIEVHASNDKTFSTYDVLGIGEHFDKGEILRMEFDAKKKYQYLRFYKSSYVCISELRAYEAISTGDEVPEVSYSDITDESLKNAVEMIGAFGVTFEDNGDSLFNEDKTVSRAEFASLLANALNISPAKVRNDFADMKEHPLVNAAKAVDDYNIMKATGNKFNPNTAVSVKSAVMYALNALGYGPFLDSVKADYYMPLANNLELFNGFDSMDGKLTRKNAAYLIKNMFEAECFEIVSINNKAEATYDKGDTLMDIRGFYHGTGIMYANQHYSLSVSMDKCDEGYVYIDNELFANQINRYIHNIGYMVDYYYKVVNDEKLLYFVARRENQSDVKIQGDTMPSVSNNVITYYGQNNSRRKISISNSTIVMYNGKVIDRQIDNTLMPTKKTGHIEAIDSNHDNIYDVLKIFDGTDRFLSRVSDDGVGVYLFIEGETVKINKNSDEFSINAYIGSEVVSDAGSVPPGRVVTVGKSIDGKHWELYVSMNDYIEEAKITKIYNDKITIDYLDTYERSVDLSGTPVELGQRGTVYFNYLGQIAYFNITTQSYKTGLLVAAAYEQEAFDGKLLVKVYTQSGSINIFTVDKSIKIDGVLYTNLSQAATKLNTLLNQTGEYSEVPMNYKANMSLKIKEIDTIYDDKALTDPTAEDDDLTELINGTYYIMYGVINGLVNSGSETMVVNRYPDEKADEDRYALRNIAYLGDAHDYSFKAYGSRTKGRLAPANMFLIDTNLSVGISMYTQFFLLESVGMGTNSKGDVVPLLYGMYDGEYKELPFKDNSVLATELPYLSCGDVIRLNVNANGEVVAGQMTFDYENLAPVSTWYDLYSISHSKPNINGFISPMSFSYGTVYEIEAEKNLMEVREVTSSLTIEDPATPYRIMHPSYFSRIYYCDVDRGTVRTGKWSELKAYVDVKNEASKIVTRCTDGKHAELIIYSK